MNQRDLLEELRLADPAPINSERPEGVWSSAAVLQSIQQRRGKMQTIERQKPPPEQPKATRKRGLLVAAAAFIVAVIMAGVVVANWGTSNEPKVGSVTSTTAADDGVRQCPTGLVRIDDPLSTKDLRCGILSGADLAGADLTGADLSGASMSGADLTGANLSGALLIGTNLSAAVLTDADLTDADLTGAAGFLGEAVTNAVFAGARYNDNTVFPPGFDPEAEGWVKVDG